METKNAPKTVEVNLLPGDDLEGRPGGKFLKWALSWGKRIVIATEAIVIAAFLSRFWLDATVADLGDRIADRKSIIEGSANFEKKFRTTTEQIAAVKGLETYVSPLVAFDRASGLIPEKIVITSILLGPKEIRISGSGGEQSLALLVKMFSKSPDFSDLTVEKVSKVSSQLSIDFSMQAAYVGGKNKNTK